VELNVAEKFASDLVYALCATKGLNDFFENVLPPIAQMFGAERVVLIDYYEHTNHFDVLYFEGYPERARFDLQRGLLSMDLQKALSQRDPYYSGTDLNRLYLPLYFETILEAVIVFESGSAIEITQLRRQIGRIVSKFIGLLMSSGRLAFNQGGVVDLGDLQRARQIQLTYLPADSLETDRYEVYGYNCSSSIVGGDYFDYFRSREDTIQCVVADASGHGLSAALIMSTFRGLLHAGIAECRNCADVFTTLNRTVHSGSTVVQYLTGVLLDFDEKLNRLTYTNAGHFDPAIIRPDGRIERLPGGGPPLGMFKSSQYAAAEAEVGPGDLMVLFTDGLTDLRDSSHEFFGEERILEYVSGHRGRPLKEIAAEVLNEGITFSAAPQPEDDLTLFMMRFR
jgi:serine phosphatase RsbU (regulator of sigma subunit)